MPTKRTRRAHARAFEFDETVRIHLELGDCLLAGYKRGCFCGLRGPDGIEREDLVRAAREHFDLKGEPVADQTDA